MRISHDRTDWRSVPRRAPALNQLADHPAIIVDLDRPAVGRVVGGVERNAQAVINRRRHVFGVVGSLGRLFAQGIGLADRDSGRMPPPAKSAIPAVDQ